jgi:hypothetical protein
MERSEDIAAKTEMCDGDTWHGLMVSIAAAPARSWMFLAAEYEANPLTRARATCHPQGRCISPQNQPYKNEKDQIEDKRLFHLAAATAIFVIQAQDDRLDNICIHRWIGSSFRGLSQRPG